MRASLSRGLSTWTVCGGRLWTVVWTCWGVCMELCVRGDRLPHGLCRQPRLGEALVSVYMCIARVWRVTLDHVSMECVSVCMGEQV